MPQSHARVALHLTFSTKNRHQWLKDRELCHELYAYMATILKNLDSPAILINGVADHVHILFYCSTFRAITPSGRSLRRSKKGPQNGSKNRTKRTRISIGRRAMACSPSAIPISTRCGDTLRINRSITERERFRRSFESCAPGTASRLMNGMRGTDLTESMGVVLFRPVGALFPVGTRIPRALPGAGLSRPFGPDEFNGDVA